MRLFIGNRNYSSWSLRPWLLMRELGIPFDEELLPFGDEPAWDEFRARGGSGRVPALEDAGVFVWDSLAIVEYLAERHRGVWPADPLARAWARCAAAEMHSGFTALRSECGMSTSVRVSLHRRSAALEVDVARVGTLLGEGLGRFGGPFLAGANFSAVDAFFAPVCFRARTYGLEFGEAVDAYVWRMLRRGWMRAWAVGARAEQFRDAAHEAEVAAAGVVTQDRREHAVRGDEDPDAWADAKWLARRMAERGANLVPWAMREGLVRFGTIPQHRVRQGLNRTLPASADARRLVALVEDALGARAERDPWATPDEICLLVRDPARPEWYLPTRVLYYHGAHVQLKGPSMEIALPARAERMAARREKAEAEAAARGAAESTVVDLPRGGPARLRISEGPSYVEWIFGQRGERVEQSATVGDHYAFGYSDEEPFTVDPLARPRQSPPVSFLCRDEIDEDGVSIETFARWVAERPLHEVERARVFMPVPSPGGVCGAAARVERPLRRADVEGRIFDDAGWVVIDAWNNTAITCAATLEEAFADWRALVAQVQPLPPVEKAAAPPPPEPPPPEPERKEGGELVKLPDPNVVTAGFTMEIRMEPPVRMAWPTPRPEHVPAVAWPIPARPPVPPELAAAGFTRSLRLYGDHGEVASGWVREHVGGWSVFVGDEALPALVALGLATVLAELDGIDHAADEDRPSPFGESWRRYPVEVRHYRLWDDLGRTPELRGGSTAYQSEFDLTHLEPGARYGIVRWRPNRAG